MPVPRHSCHHPAYWPGTAKRLIRINWIDTEGFPTIYRLVTSRVVVKDLEVLVPPNFMIFWRASFRIGPKHQTKMKNRKKQVQTFKIQVRTWKKHANWWESYMFRHFCEFPCIFTYSPHPLYIFACFLIYVFVFLFAYFQDFPNFPTFSN